MVDRVNKIRGPLLILTLIAVATLSIRSFIVSHIVQPIALLIWSAWRVISSVDQQIYWYLLAVFCLMVFIRLLLSGSDAKPSSAYPFESLPPDRLAYWQSLMSRAALGGVDRAHLIDELKVLLLKVSVDQHCSDSAMADEITVDGWPSLPVEFKHSLLSIGGKTGTRVERLKMAITSRLPLWIRRWLSTVYRTDPTWIDETLKWMEAELDINNGE